MPKRENIATAQVSSASVPDIRNKIALLSAPSGEGALKPLFCLWMFMVLPTNVCLPALEKPQHDMEIPD